MGNGGGIGSGAALVAVAAVRAMEMARAAAAAAAARAAATALWAPAVELQGCPEASTSRVVRVTCTRARARYGAGKGMITRHVEQRATAVVSGHTAGNREQVGVAACSWPALARPWCRRCLWPRQLVAVAQRRAWSAGHRCRPSMPLELARPKSDRESCLFFFGPGTVTY